MVGVAHLRRGRRVGAVGLAGGVGGPVAGHHVAMHASGLECALGGGRIGRVLPADDRAGAREGSGRWGFALAGLSLAFVLASRSTLLEWPPAFANKFPVIVLVQAVLLALAWGIGAHRRTVPVAAAAQPEGGTSAVGT